MNCKKAQIWLQGYVDGELSPGRMQRLRKHMDGCSECRGEFSRLSQLKTLLAENRTHPAMEAAPEFFWSQVKGRIQGELQPRRAFRTQFSLAWPQVFAWAGACAVVMAVGAVVWMQSLPKPAPVAVVAPQPAEAQVDWIVTKGPDLYAQAYHSKESRATIIWTEGMPVISLEF